VHSALLARSAVIALVGLALEARMAAGPNVLVVCHNQGQEPTNLIKNAIRAGCRGIISFGIAGGLAPGLRPGDWIVASAVTDQQRTWITDAAWSARMLQMIPGSSYSPILGIDAPVADPSTKRELYRATEAAAVDMESHVVARLAGSYGLAFAALRVIIDPVERLIPNAALVGLDRTGNIAFGDILRGLLGSPCETIALARLGCDFLIARNRLAQVRHLLASGFCYSRAPLTY
jgi:adenosylhomocysteine nucleosidase